MHGAMDSKLEEIEKWHAYRRVQSIPLQLGKPHCQSIQWQCLSLQKDFSALKGECALDCKTESLISPLTCRSPLILNFSPTKPCGIRCPGTSMYNAYSFRTRAEILHAALCISFSRARIPTSHGRRCFSATTQSLAENLAGKWRTTMTLSTLFITCIATTVEAQVRVEHHLWWSRHFRPCREPCQSTNEALGTR